MTPRNRRNLRSLLVFFAGLAVCGLAAQEPGAQERGGVVVAGKLSREQALAYLEAQKLDPDPDFLLSLVLNGEVETVEALLAAGVDVNTPNMLGKPILRVAMSACAAGRQTPERQLAMVEVLLRYGAEVNEKGGELCALMVAAQHCPATIVRRLLVAGADYDFKTSLGHSPLSMAFIMENYAAAEALIEGGARLSAAGAAKLAESKKDNPQRAALLKKAQGG